MKTTTLNAIATKLALLMIAAVLIAGCGSEDITGTSAPNVTEEEEQIVIKTPRRVIIDKIQVRDFSSKKSNGNDWDWDPISATPRRPDIRVSLQRSGYTPAYSSNTVKNAKTDTDYTFTQPASVYDGHLPHEFAYSTTYKIHLVDDDFGGDETMHSASFKGSSVYKKDNATSFTATISGDRSFKLRIYGRFVY